jgi:hypothetical protein
MRRLLRIAVAPPSVRLILTVERSFVAEARPLSLVIVPPLNLAGICRRLKAGNFIFAALQFVVGMKS